LHSSHVSLAPKHASRVLIRTHLCSFRTHYHRYQTHFCLSTTHFCASIFTTRTLRLHIQRWTVTSHFLYIYTYIHTFQYTSSPIYMFKDKTCSPIIFMKRALAFLHIQRWNVPSKFFTPTFLYKPLHFVDTRRRNMPHLQRNMFRKEMCSMCTECDLDHGRYVFAAARLYGTQLFYIEHISVYTFILYKPLPVVQT